MFILQNLAPASEYTITVASYLNNSFSPPTQNVTAFTPAIGKYSWRRKALFRLFVD